MRGSDFHQLEAFLAVAETGSFRRAAEAMGVSPSAISHTIRLLEERTGTRLFHRTTRSVALTEAGTLLRNSIAPAFQAISASMAQMASRSNRLTGTIRITAPRAACDAVLAPFLPGFLLRHSGIRVEVDANDRLVDAVAEGFDAGIRPGHSLRGDMESHAVSPLLRGIHAAAPAYLDRYGHPSTPGDLLDHRWLNLRLSSDGRLMPWEFERGGDHVELSLPGPLASNDLSLLVGAAIAGCGIVWVPEGMIDAELADGRLVQILADCTVASPGWFVYYPKGRVVPPALKRFIDELRDAAAGRA